MNKTLTYSTGHHDVLVTTTPDIPEEDIEMTCQISWTHIQGSEPDNLKYIIDKLSLNELSITDSQRERHPPKFEAFEKYLFIILRPIESHSDSTCVFKQLSIFLGDRYLATKSFDSVNAIEKVWSSYEDAEFDNSRGVRNIVYKIFRNVADDYLRIIYDIESKLEEIEDNIEHDLNDVYLADLTKYNSSLRKIVRNLEYQEKVAISLVNFEDRHSSDQISHEFRDVHEQVERALSLANMYQGLCNDLINAHISMTSHKVNQVVKILTIVTVLFLPLSFIVGLYGMNFEFIPELKLKYGYFYVLGLMVTVEIGLIILLKKLKWI